MGLISGSRLQNIGSAQVCAPIGHSLIFHWFVVISSLLNFLVADLFVCMNLKYLIE